VALNLIDLVGSKKKPSLLPKPHSLSYSQDSRAHHHWPNFNMLWHVCVDYKVLPHAVDPTMRFPTMHHFCFI